MLRCIYPESFSRRTNANGTGSECAQKKESRFIGIRIGRGETRVWLLLRSKKFIEQRKHVSRVFHSIHRGSGAD